MIGAFNGCKKDSNKKSDCRVAEVSIAGGQNIEVSYGSDGKVNSFSTGNGTLVSFTYKGDTVQILHTDSGQFGSRVTVVNNVSGLATYVRTDYDQAGTQWGTTKYEYNGDQLATSKDSSYAGTSSTTTYAWFNGNMVVSASGTQTTSSDYYTDKPYQPGDYLYFAQLLQGYQILRNKNLVKSTTGGSFNYSFDGDGHISAMEIVEPNSAAVINYTYQCN